MFVVGSKTEEIEIVDTKSIMVAENINLSDWLKVLREVKLKEDNSWHDIEDIYKAYFYVCI
ncbi:MAG: hypothetical protein WCC17_12015 [Candidatus Nitrosopolaris sp.]